MRERNRLGAELALFELEGAPRSSRVPRVDSRTAARLNRSYARTLGWRKKLRQIANILNLRGRSFPEAVADWQKSQGLPPDGVLGPRSWSRMAPRLKGETEREYFESEVRLTAGAVGLAFDPLLVHGKVPTDVVPALNLAKRFQEIAKKLDDVYVAQPDLSTETVEAGVIVTSPDRKRRGKRVLLVSGDPLFTRFAPFGSIETDVDQDTIIIHAPPSAPSDHWVSQIALGTALGPRVGNARDARHKPEPQHSGRDSA